MAQFIVFLDGLLSLNDESSATAWTVHVTLEF